MIARFLVVLLALSMRESNASLVAKAELAVSGEAEVSAEASNTAVEAAADAAAVAAEDEANVVEDADAVAPDLAEKKRRWMPPDYANQGPALGYKADTFAIPEKMRERVQFWMDIYTKYTSDEGLLHDSLHVKAVYEPVDFRPIMADGSLSAREKARARKKLLEERKKAVKEILLGLHSKTTGKNAAGFDPATLSAEESRIYNMFVNDTDPNKFKAAAQKGRLRFQLGQRDKFIQGIYYSGRYLREMERIFHEAGLPIELTRLPFVESSFNVRARSRVGASGIWQFMRYTGRKFLRISGTSDERNDPIKATRAAARMLRINYEMLQDWPLAVTGYNHGPAGVARMVKKFNTSDISDLVDERHGRFGFASANFYASFLAAVHIEREANKYFGDVYWDSTVMAEEIKTVRPVSKKMLLSWFDGDVEKAKDLNPHLTRTFWAGYGTLTPKDFIRVPAAKAEVARLAMTAPVNGRGGAGGASGGFAGAAGGAGGASGGFAGAAGGAGGDISGEHAGFETYVIGPGETLSEIAVQFGLSLSRLIDLNDIDNPRRIRAGQKILVPKK